MKKLSVLLLISLFFVIFLSACKSDNCDIFEEALDIYNQCKTAPRSVGYYVMNANEGDSGYISKEHFCSLYGKSSDCREYDYICDFCIVYSRRDSVREVHIIKAYTESECREIATMLSMRAQAVTKGEYIEKDKSYFKAPSNADVTINGKYAYLIIS